MADQDPAQHVFFINNYFGSFYSGVLNWVATELYPRVNFKVLGTYDKSVEYFNKKKELSKEVDLPILPSVTLDPSYDFEPATPEGKFLWSYPNLAPGLGSKLFNDIEGISKDQDVRVTPVFTKYAGTFELIFWLHSIYELLDLRVLLYQYTGGYGRLIRPRFFESFIILPDQVINHETGHGIPIDWSGTTTTTKLVDNIGHNRFCLPIILTPWFKLTSVNDGSQKYGGDSVAEYKLTAVFDYEINMPTFINIEDWPFLDKIQYRMEFGATYSLYGKHPVYNPVTHKYVKDDVNKIPSDIIASNASNEGTPPHGLPYEFEERIIYMFTGSEPVVDSYIFITNPFSVTPDDRIALVSYNGILNKGDDGWLYDVSTNKFRIFITPKIGEGIEFYRYRN